MSVALIVLEPKNEKYSRMYIPIATEELYEDVWQKGAQALNAEWLPLFQSGVALTVEDFGAVTRELLAFEQWLKTAPIDPELRAFVSGRVNLLLKNLTSLAEDKEVKVFIG